MEGVRGCLRRKLQIHQLRQYAVYGKTLVNKHWSDCMCSRECLIILNFKSHKKDFAIPTCGGELRASTTSSAFSLTHSTLAGSYYRSSIIWDKSRLTKPVHQMSEPIPQSTRLSVLPKKLDRSESKCTLFTVSYWSRRCTIWILPWQVFSAAGGSPNSCT